MKMEELTKVLREAGVVGAGGAGFPSYAKLNKAADTIVLNCAECEPLLKLHRQVLEKYALEIMTALDIVADACEVNRVIIAVKGSYKGAIDAVKANLDSFKKIEIGILPEIYPAGDEVITIYETTGRVVPPGSIPISVGVIVYNVETMLNAYNAIKNSEPVTEKYITVAGEVKNPITVKVPLGTRFDDVIALAGGTTIDDYVIINGGPMTGPKANIFDTVTKTTNALLILPSNSFVAEKRKQNVKVDVNRAKSACCQCRMCTDLCPRNLLGHPIEPHAFMNALANNAASQVDAVVNTFFCSQCGLCEMYSCFQGLSPKTLIGVAKGNLRKNGVSIPKVDAAPVEPKRDYRRVPMKRLTARLGLTQYNLPAPLDETAVKPTTVKIKLSQHIGAPCVAKVSVGDKVEKGQVIGCTDEGKLGVCIHSSIAGSVVDVNDQFVTVKA
ncbi:MAG: SLBB domain-containing protein [Clostridia bacterium]|nr:SLBB domain-containing protein [Clostridia bacterium]